MEGTAPHEDDPRKYHFIQTFTTITISFRVPSGTTTSDVLIDLTDTTIKVSLPEEKPIVEGTFFAPIIASRKVLELEPSKNVASLHLTKQRPEYWTLLIKGNRVDDNEESMDPNSQYELGKYLELSLEQDVEAALELFLKAANNGLLEAQKRVAMIFLGLDPISKDQHCFVKINPKRGITYLKMAAKQHESLWAMLQLGNIYSQGIHSTEKNLDEAEKWYLRAALHDDSMAMYHLGVLKMEAGEIELSVHWWQKSAERGCAEAYIQLGLLYLKGLLPNEERNVHKAREYFQKAVQLKPSLHADVPSEGVMERLSQQTQQKTRKPQSRTTGKKSTSRRGLCAGEALSLPHVITTSDERYTPSVSQRRIKLRHEESETIKAKRTEPCTPPASVKTAATWSVLAVTGLIAAFVLHKFIETSTHS